MLINVCRRPLPAAAPPWRLALPRSLTHADDRTLGHPVLYYEMAMDGGAEGSRESPL